MRQEIVDQITNSLKQITIANGYLTDVGKQVREWEYIDEVNPSSVLQVRDPQCTYIKDDNIDNALEDKHTKQLTVQIVNIASEGINQPGLAPRTLRLVIRDILHAIDSIDWIAGVVNVELGDNIIGGQQESRKYIGVSQTVIITYQCDAWTD